MDNTDYTTAFALVGMAEAIAVVLGVVPSQTRRQTRQPERLCQNCGKQGHRANACTTPVAAQEQPVVAPLVAKPVATATVKVISDNLSPAEAARIAKIRMPGSRYKPKALGVADVQAIERVRCCGETHRLALLNDGKVAVLDHPRKLFRLQGWAAKSAGLKAPDGCWAKLLWLQENAGRSYGDHGMLSKAKASSRKRDKKAGRVPNPVDHERGKNYLVAERAHELALAFKTSVVRWQAESITTLNAITLRFSTNMHVTNVKGTGRVALVKHKSYSGRTSSCSLRINVVRWYVTVYKKNLASIARNALLLEVLDTDVINRPSRVTVLRKGKSGVECVEATVQYGPSGRARLVATATLTSVG